MPNTEDEKTKSLCCLSLSFQILIYQRCQTDNMPRQQHSRKGIPHPNLLLCNFALHVGHPKD